MPTSEDILDATEEVLRRFGPEKATVVDVARTLDVSHGTVYRHYSSKSALWSAVIRRWLRRVEQPLAKIVKQEGTARARLYRWLKTLISIKREKRRKDPEMFATYYALAKERERIVSQHVEVLIEQLTKIIRHGKSEGVFHVEDSEAEARAVFDATSRFHHPARADSWDQEGVDKHFEAVWHLLDRGLSTEG